MKKVYWILAISIVVNVALLILVVIGHGPSQQEPDDQTYPYLSKRLFTEHQNDVILNFVPLRASLRKYAQQTKEPLSIYFEYLPSGTSVEINEKETFFGASLLKLPVAMKVYKLIDQGKLSGSQEVTIKPENIDKGFGTLWQRGAGAKLTIDEAIKLSIGESDNTADKVLRELVGSGPVSDVFDYLDIETDIAEGPGAGVTTNGFSSVLRALYLSAYLPYEKSNKLLDTMTTSPYKDRIVAGVPQGVKVAHKVGIYKQPDNENNQVHSDCGIVYAPKRPYILCIMSKDKIDLATKYMQDISKTVYDYISTVNRNGT